MFYNSSISRKFLIFIPFIFIGISCSLISQAPKVSSKSKFKKVPVKEIQKLTKHERTVLNQAEKAIVSSFLKPPQITQLKKILKLRRSPSAKARVKMVLARHFLKKKSYKKALSYYTQVTHPKWRVKSSLGEVKVYYQINKFKKARKLLDLLIEEESPSLELLMDMYLLRLKIISRQDSTDKKDLLEVYCQILELKQNKDSIYKDKARLILFNMSDNEVLDISSKEFIKPIEDLIFFRVGKIFFFREKFKRAHLSFKKFLRLSTDGFLEEKALKYIQSIESRKKVNRKYIGAILPLSGPSANIGKRSLRGLKMGLGFYTNKRSNFQLIVLDSQGQADKTRQAVQTLVIKHHVIAIVGGVLSRTSKVLAEESQNFGVPTILMSQKSHLSKVGRYIFQNGLTSSLVTQQLTQYLIKDLKKTQFAILYPNDLYGVDYANAFWSAVEEKGGEIIGAQFYKPGETDFNGPIKRLTGTYYLEDRKKEYKSKLREWYSKKTYLHSGRADPPKNIVTPIVNFDVLFIPDSIKTLRLIAPHLAYNDIKDVKLAGPTLWNQKKILKKHSKYLDNVIFVAEGFATKEFKKTDFYKKFIQIFGSPPRLFEVLSYESALALHQVIAGGADDRNELRKKLEGLKKFHGPMGEIVISKNREFLRSMQIFRMKDKQLTPIALSN